MLQLPGIQFFSMLLPSPQHRISSWTKPERDYLLPIPPVHSLVYKQKSSATHGFVFRKRQDMH